MDSRSVKSFIFLRELELHIVFFQLKIEQLEFCFLREMKIPTNTNTIKHVTAQTLKVQLAKTIFSCFPGKK